MITFVHYFISFYFSIIILIIQLLFQLFHLFYFILFYLLTCESCVAEWDKEILRPFFPWEYFLSFRLSLSTQGGVKKQRHRKLLFVLSFPFPTFNAHYSKC